MNLELTCLSKTESTEDVQPGEAPPTVENAIHTETDSQSQDTEETATAGQPARPVANDAGEL